MSTHVFIPRYGLDDNFRGPEDEGIPDKYLEALTAISVNIPEGRYGTRYNGRHSTIFELIQLLCTKCLICSICFILFFCFHNSRSSCIISVDSKNNVIFHEKALLYQSIDPNNRMWAFKMFPFKIKP